MPTERSASASMKRSDRLAGVRLRCDRQCRARSSAACRRRQAGRRVPSRAARCEPLRQPARIVANVRVAELFKQADRLRAERSSRAAAVDDDGARERRAERSARAPGDSATGQVDRAGKMRRGERLGREDVDERHETCAQARQ